MSERGRLLVRMDDQVHRLMTVSELSDWLNCSRAMVYNLCRDGMPWFALGTDRRFDRDSVLEWLESRKVAEREVAGAAADVGRDRAEQDRTEAVSVR